MKLFKCVILVLLTVMLIPTVYICVYSASIIPYCFFVQVLACIVMVATDKPSK